MDFPREEQELSAETIRKAHHRHNADKGAMHHVTHTDAPGASGGCIDPPRYVATGRWQTMTEAKPIIYVYGGGGGGGNKGSSYFPPPLYQDVDKTIKVRHSTTYLDLIRMLHRLRKQGKIPSCTLETSREYRDTVTIRVSSGYTGKPFTLTWDLPPHAKSSKQWQNAILSKF